MSHKKYRNIICNYCNQGYLSVSLAKGWLRCSMCSFMCKEYVDPEPYPKDEEFDYAQAYNRMVEIVLSYRYGSSSLEEQLNSIDDALDAAKFDYVSRVTALGALEDAYADYTDVLKERLFTFEPYPSDEEFAFAWGYNMAYSKGQLLGMTAESYKAALIMALDVSSSVRDAYSVGVSAGASDSSKNPVDLNR